MDNLQCYCFTVFLIFRLFSRSDSPWSDNNLPLLAFNAFYIKWVVSLLGSLYKKPHKENCLNLELFFFKVIDCKFYIAVSLWNSKFYLSSKSCSASDITVLCLSGSKMDNFFYMELIVCLKCTGFKQINKVKVNIFQAL